MKLDKTQRRAIKIVNLLKEILSEHKEVKSILLVPILKGDKTSDGLNVTRKLNMEKVFKDE